MESQQQTFTRWLGNLFLMPAVWIFIVLLSAIASNWWHSVYLMIPFIFSSLCAWITYDAAYPAEYVME